MKIEGHITIWFNSNSLFKMEFHQVNVVEAIELLKLIQDALKNAPAPQDAYAEPAIEQKEVQDGA